MRSARKRTGALAATAAVLALAVAACGSSSNTPPSSSGPPVKGGTATVAVTSGTQPNYIWPFVPATHYSVYNSEMFRWLMYRPLYMFGNNGQSVAPNYGLSPANKPVYNAGGKTVTITMKGWRWSDGESVDAKDVAFWINMEKAEKTNYAGFSPGTFPDNLASYSITSPKTIVLHLKKAYSSSWFTYNQLAEITPMPLAWDVASMGAKKGSGGCATSPASRKAVYKLMSAQAQHASSYPKWIPAIQRENGDNGPYAFSIASATSLMTSHGWKTVSGAMTCENRRNAGPAFPEQLQELEYVRLRRLGVQRSGLPADRRAAV